MTDLTSIVRHIAREVAQGVLAQTRAAQTSQTGAEAADLRARIKLIMAKEFVSITEAAFLLNCSYSHIRRSVAKAKKKQTPRPIPYRDLDGVTVFHLKELLAWSEPPKSQAVL